MKKFSHIEICPLNLDGIQEEVAIHRAAFPGFFLTFLGPDFLKLLYSFYVQGKTEIALVGKYKEQVIGTLLGTTQSHGFYKRLAKRYFLRFAWASLKPLLQQPAIFPRLVRALFYRGDAPLSATGGALLASVCLDPGLQSKGIGKEMVAAFESEMWKQGAKFVYLTTDLDNNQATQRFYEKIGWSIESKFTTPEGRLMRRYWKMRPTD
jgi:GNAT superfamily N-acetyltransferase